MKKMIMLGLALALTSGNLLFAQKRVKFKSETDSLNYAMGMLLGESFDNPVFDDIRKGLDHKLLLDAFRVSSNGQQTAMSREEAMEFIQRFMERSQAKAAEENLAAGRKFLEDNAKKEGVVVLASGLQYKVIREGDGNHPTVNDKVQVRYKGMLIDGTVFDESDPDEAPVSFRPSELIDGFTEGLLLMSPGAKYILYIPRELAYGESGVGRTGQNNATLIFEVELIGIEEKEFAADTPETYDDDDYYDADDHSELRERMAGAYRALTLPETEVSYGDSEVRRSYRYGDLYYVFAYDGFFVLDEDQNALYEERYDRDEDDDPVKFVTGATFYEPLSGNGPVFLVADTRNYFDYPSGSDVYLVTGNGVEPAGHMNVAGDDGFAAYGAEGLVPVNEILEIHNGAEGIRFSFDKKLLMYNPSGEDTTFPAEDFGYIYDGDGLVPRGVALSLSYFKRMALQDKIRAEASDPVTQIVFGDLNGDGHPDLVYTLQDDNTLYVCLCRDYAVTHRFGYKMPHSFYLDNEEGPAIRNGELTVWVYDEKEEEYSPRCYVVQRNTLVGKSNPEK